MGLIKGAVVHLNTEAFIYPAARNRLNVRLHTAKEDAKSCTVVYFSRTNPERKKEARLEKVQSDEYKDYYETELEFSQVARYQKYYFRITDKDGGDWYYAADGFHETEPDDQLFEFLYANARDVAEYPQWARGAVFYQIFPDRFFCGGESGNSAKNAPWGTPPTRENFRGGNLEGIRQKISYLSDLGVEAVYLNPIFEADFNHKYATTDYYEIDPAFGTKEDFRKLVSGLHQAGIRLVLDGVFNHVGIHFRQFQDVLKNGSSSEYYDWFLLNKKEDILISHRDYECVGAYKYMPKLNTSNPKVRAFILDVMDYWIAEYQIDGWRLDVADEVDETVWQEAGVVLKEKYPELLLIGETWGYGGKLLSGTKLDCVMNYLFRDAVRDYFALDKLSAEQFDWRIHHMLALYKKETNEIMYNLLGSHDTQRFLFLCGGDKRKLKLAAAFQLLFTGAPAIYYGDEVGMTGDNPDCRGCMIWDRQQDRELLHWYQTMIRLRKEHSAIRTGRFRTILCDCEKEIYLFERRDAAETIYVFVHKGEEAVKVQCPQELREDAFTDLMKEDAIECGFGEILELEPYSVKVISKKQGG